MQRRGSLLIPLSSHSFDAAAVLVEYPADTLEAKLASGFLEAAESDNTITLPPNTFWPDLLSTVLYVRHFYKDLWESVLHSGTAMPLNHGAVILGTPGSE